MVCYSDRGRSLGRHIMKLNTKIMKQFKFISNKVLVGLVFALIITSCDQNEEITPSKDILPETFRVEIPSAISDGEYAIGGRKSGRSKEDTLQGNAIYENLGTFISIGDGAAEIVEEIILGLRRHKIDRVISLTYVSEDDNRTKNLVVASDVQFDDQTWEYQLTVTDADSEGNLDGGKAMQVFWNKRRPIQGIAIIKPYNIDREENPNAGDAIIRIDYSEVSSQDYDAEMEVFISGLPLPSPLEDPYAISTLHMFAGKKGDIVDVYGNSNHPNAILFAGNTGFNWAFVASGSDPKEIGVAEVGLPPSDLDESDRNVLLKDYSIKNVFTNEINEVWPTLDPALLASYLKNTEAPGYFSDKVGFIAGGESPGTEWDVFESRLENLSPYNPLETSNLIVVFK